MSQIVLRIIVSLMSVLLPLGSWGRKATPEMKEERHIRVVEGQTCPKCRRKVPIRSVSCPACGQSMDNPWWERF